MCCCVDEYLVCVFLNDSLFIWVDLLLKNFRSFKGIYNSCNVYLIIFKLVKFGMWKVFDVNVWSSLVKFESVSIWR